jgi:hypothetical protein
MAIEGCDQPTNHTCAVPPSSRGSTAQPKMTLPAKGVACLTHQSSNSDVSEPTGQDYLNTFMSPSAYQFQILAGSNNPMVAPGLPSGSPVTVSASIVSLPIFDETAVTLHSGGPQTRHVCRISSGVYQRGGQLRQHQRHSVECGGMR